MILNPKREIAIVLVGLIVSFALGRYSIDPPAVKTIEVSKTVTQQEEKKDVHVQTKTIIVELPTGAKTTTTTVDTVVTDAKDTDTKVQDEKIHTEIPNPKNTLNISALVAQDMHALGVPSYGISVQKQFIGPVTIGVFGLTSGIIGISIGLNF